jgi:hypothetical protein
MKLGNDFFTSATREEKKTNLNKIVGPNSSAQWDTGLLPTQTPQTVPFTHLPLWPMKKKRIEYYNMQQK